MDCRCRKDDQNHYLEDLGIPVEYFQIIHVCQNDSSLRIKLKSEKDIEKFLKDWNASAHVTWRVTSTNPGDMAAGKKNIFYHKYHCHHKGEIDPNPSRTSKRIGCTAEMTITIKKIGKRCQSKDVHLPEYSTKITLKNLHNHSLTCADALKWMDVSAETRTEFLNLFEKGYHPYSALDAFKENLLLEHGGNYFTVSQNRSLCPDIAWCYRLYYSIQRNEYGGMEDSDVVLKKIKDLQLEESVQSTFHEGRLIIAICTPLMKRVHQFWPYSAEMMFMDSTGNFDKLQHRVFVLMTHSFAGALPLGVIITCTEKGESLAVGLRLLMKIVGENAFYNRNLEGPAIIMTDHSISERNGISQVFPSARLLLCTFHILQAVWRYLWKNDTGIPNNRKAELYNLIRQLVYERDVDELNAKYQKLMDNDVVNDKMKKYITNLWMIREEWGHGFRDGLSRNNNTNNYAESTMRILKDKIFNRQKAYNVVQLLDFICSRLDNYYEKKLLDVALGKSRAMIQSRYTPSQKITNLEVVRGGDDTSFLVRNSLKKTEYYVDTANEICSCYVGCTGAPCKHQSAVLKNFPYETNNFYTATNEQRLLLHKLATGTTANVPNDWYQPLLQPCISKDVPECTDGNQTSAKPPTEDQNNNGITIATPCNKNDNKENNPNDEASTPEQRESIRLVFNKFKNLFNTKIMSVSGILMFEKFFQKVFGLKTDSALENALYNFGKHVSSRKITVQSTSISRRKTKLSGKNPITPGRPLKCLTNLDVEHQYATVKGSKVFKRKRRPHSLQFCAQENIK